MWRLLQVRRGDEADGAKTSAVEQKADLPKPLQAPPAWPYEAAARRAPTAQADWFQRPIDLRQMTGGGASIPKPAAAEVNENHHEWSKPVTIVGKSLCDMSDQALEEGAKLSSTKPGSTPPILSFIRCVRSTDTALPNSIAGGRPEYRG